MNFFGIRTGAKTIHLNDLPNDCLRSILGFVLFELTRTQILDLFTVSKCIFKVSQDPSLPLELFSFLFNQTEIGKQIIFSKKKEKNWQSYFELFRHIQRLQKMQILFIKRRKWILPFTVEENSTLKTLIERDKTIFEKNIYSTTSRQKEKNIFSQYSLAFDTKLIEKDFLPSIESVTFSNNLIFGIPNSISLLISLKKINFSNNDLIYISSEIGNCVHLEEVSFANNKIETLPKEIGIFFLFFFLILFLFIVCCSLFEFVSFLLSPFFSLHFFLFIFFFS